jgi:hypothetical protein
MKNISEVKPDLLLFGNKAEDNFFIEDKLNKYQ